MFTPHVFKERGAVTIEFHASEGGVDSALLAEGLAC